MNLLTSNIHLSLFFLIFNISFLSFEPDPLLGLTEEECAREAFTYYDNAIHSEVDIAAAFEVSQFVYLQCLAINDH
ncbi:hypothetical protein [Winogradskyella sp.]|uniref:hypothetical protein n=1 Tax=Winogradskyella sp. TaxID=1883156 RepID=UPI0025E74BD8|nr:hypothetical protein [Winogradskyella sp.]MBT8244406.1 hypothetical protein [Winogradskyella sp.]